MALTNGHGAGGHPLTVMIDNYDSFSYNVTQYLSLLGANVLTFRNDEITLDELQRLDPTNLVISPGPGHPDSDAGQSQALIRHFAGKIPILGVCMGCQCIARVYGANVESIGTIVHGKTSAIVHDGKGIYRGVPQDFQATRYHSLAPVTLSVPGDHEDLVISSRTKDGIVMGLRHRRYTVESVQYHPESILSQAGHLLLQNFMELKGGTWAENPQFEMAGLGEPAESSTAAKPSILKQIYRKRKEDVQLLKASPGTTLLDLQLQHSLQLAPPSIDFKARLLQRPNGATLSIMGEIKRASPSKGIFDSQANAPDLALRYASAGASAISVLTEPHWFKGSLNDVRQVRKALDRLPNRPAVLRKEFIMETYQILEARLAGADSVLLIVAMLDDDTLKQLYTYSKSLLMEPLVEVNNADEMIRALELGAQVIGVNNRNLHDFNVDMTTTSKLSAMISKDVLLCALSGIKERKDVEGYENEGIAAVLVGEHLMLSKDKGRCIAQLLNLQLDGSGTSPSLSTAATVKPFPVHKVSPKLKAYQSDLISTSLANRILLFGSFTLKSGRISPYFFNAGLFCTGALLDLLAACFASCIVDSGIEFDVIFGPAYKGVPLATATAMALVKNHNVDVPWCFNRKEAKDHGEGGSLVGSSLKGKRVLMVDDVITDGAAKREAYEIIKAAGGQLAAIFVSVDREEMTVTSEKKAEESQGPRTSGLQDVSRDLGCPVRSIVRLIDIINYISLKGNMDNEIKAMMEYRARYGVDSEEGKVSASEAAEASAPVSGAPSSLPSSSRPLVKICGIKTTEAARAAIEAGADLLGLIFAPASKRRVTLDEAHAVAKVVRGARHGREPSRPMERVNSGPMSWFSYHADRIKRHPRKPLLVGVFQNQPLEWIRDMVDAVGLDLVQLHGSEPLEWTRWIQVPVIKAFHVPQDGSMIDAVLEECSRPGYHALAVLDTANTGSAGQLSGGAGVPFDWTVAQRLVNHRVPGFDHAQGAEGLPIVLAGGLNAENIVQAISTVRPFIVDVNSGVETDGAKDVGKIKRLLEMVKGG